MKRNLNYPDLTDIPYVGKSIANDFRRIGITKVADLIGKDPEKIYLMMCQEQGYPLDRCLLYVCRSSVYFAENENHDPEKLKWWNWKDP